MYNNADFLSKLIRGELGLESPTPIRYQYFAQDLSANTLSHWVIPASTKADWSLSNILPLLFLRLRLHNLIIFCTLINSQLLNEVRRVATAPLSPPTHYIQHQCSSENWNSRHEYPVCSHIYTNRHNLHLTMTNVHSSSFLAEYHLNQLQVVL